jgi:hypothetical protein
MQRALLKSRATVIAAGYPPRVSPRGRDRDIAVAVMGSRPGRSRILDRIARAIAAQPARPSPS